VVLGPRSLKGADPIAQARYECGDTVGVSISRHLQDGHTELVEVPTKLNC
jgi:hypothetical protein